MKTEMTPGTATGMACCRPLAAPTLSDEQAGATAALFKALGDPARVRIVNMLANAGGPVCTCELAAPLGLSLSTVSHHLSRLLAVGLVTREQRGRWASFSLDPTALRRLSWAPVAVGFGEGRLVELHDRRGSSLPARGTRPL